MNRLLLTLPFLLLLSACDEAESDGDPNRLEAGVPDAALGDSDTPDTGAPDSDTPDSDTPDTGNDDGGTPARGHLPSA